MLLEGHFAVSTADVESLGRAYNQRGSTFSAEQRSLVAQKMEELPDLVREMPLDTTAAMTVGEKQRRRIGGQQHPHPLQLQ
jgi:hypothetical protein